VAALPAAMPPGADDRAARRRRLLRRVLVWSVPIAVAYVGVFVYLWVIQERLIFKVRPLSPLEAREIAAAFPAARSVRIAAADGTALHAWYLAANPPSAPRRLLLYFGGNSEQVHWLLARQPALAGWDLLLVDYRGYGLSGGVPSQAALEGDADQWLRLARSGNESVARPQRLVVMGTSMGSYVATHLAASHPVDGVVLVVPYDSGVSIVQSMMPLYPIAWIVRHRFETIADAPKVRAPTIFFVAARDAFGSAERSHRLYDHWGSASRTWVDLPNANHYTATADPLYWQRLGEFLRGL